MHDDAYHHGNLRKALLDAGERLLERDGGGGLSLRDLARTAGVSHAAPYRHFASKSDLLAALATRGFDRLHDKLDNISADANLDARGQFLASCKCYIDLGVAWPAMYRLMFGDAARLDHSNPELREAGKGAFDSLVASIVRGQEAGFFRQGPPHVLAVTVWSLVHGLTDLAIAGQLSMDCDLAPDGEDVSDAACALLLSGLALPDRHP
ncbi:transcriptional regulator, TetR family [Solidesulfovibrio fructosivorans JJ]]|uniref:Transcriptional regulator, TetR family n=1 Tax=Solidesulfovibrio fructosivorans JJ] TaxID=596151 RepID=E1JVD3_SOLFR|nr:TetR/AcrR family transcriptional regulator [Solidesulfovibrio fructosivorans]EFL51727.1 transcriptional regulator, TetR family [Solidesulfovibrio fructosivorans JJ]]